MAIPIKSNTAITATKETPKAIAKKEIKAVSVPERETITMYGLTLSMPDNIYDDTGILTVQGFIWLFCKRQRIHLMSALNQEIRSNIEHASLYTLAESEQLDRSFLSACIEAMSLSNIKSVSTLPEADLTQSEFFTWLQNEGRTEVLEEFKASVAPSDSLDSIDKAKRFILSKVYECKCLIVDNLRELSIY